jgi:hypothetical protein
VHLLSSTLLLDMSSVKLIYQVINTKTTLLHHPQPPFKAKTRSLPVVTWSFAWKRLKTLKCCFMSVASTMSIMSLRSRTCLQAGACMCGGRASLAATTGTGMHHYEAINSLHCEPTPLNHASYSVQTTLTCTAPLEEHVPIPSMRIDVILPHINRRSCRLLIDWQTQWFERNALPHHPVTSHTPAALEACPPGNSNRCAA